MRLWDTLTAVLIGMSVVLALNAQELHKCIDANGKVSYSDQACVEGDTAKSVRVTPVVPAGTSSQGGNVLVTHNMKTLAGCESGDQTACFEKQLLEKRCLSQRKKGTGIPLTDCKEFESDRNKYRLMLSDCKNRKREDACLFIACAGGEIKSCELMKAVEEKHQKSIAERITTAQKQGLPSGYGWYMSQAWHTYSDGSQAAIITCNIPGKPDSSNISVALTKKPPEPHLIQTGVTGKGYFTTVEEAASKACGKYQ